MNNKSCTDNMHKFGLWDINFSKNIAWRCCDKCGIRHEFPITDEIADEVNKQEEAAKIFRAFQLVNDDDSNILNYLELILEDYLGYLSKQNVILLFKRIKKLEKKNIIDAKNMLYLYQLETYLVIDNLDSLSDSEEFISFDEISINTNSYEQGWVLIVHNALHIKKHAPSVFLGFFEIEGT